MTEHFGLGLFGLGPGLFGLGLRSSVNYAHP
jgi:hypothetical protein